MSLRRTPTALRIPISRVRSDRDEHDVHHADPVDQQRDRSDFDEQRRKRLAAGRRRLQNRGIELWLVMLKLLVEVEPGVGESSLLSVAWALLTLA